MARRRWFCRALTKLARREMVVSDGALRFRARGRRRITRGAPGAEPAPSGRRAPSQRHGDARRPRAADRSLSHDGCLPRRRPRGARARRPAPRGGGHATRSPRSPARVATAGRVGRRRRTVSSSSILPGWVAIDARAELAQRIEVEVEVDNDANLGALGELTFGAARGLADVVYVKIATGIGAGLILDGSLRRGATGIAGELGHVQVNFDGVVCNCGGRGCLQTLASTESLLAAARAAHGPELTLAGLIELVNAGDFGSRRLVGEAGRAVGAVLADLCNHVNPEAIVVGGDLSGAGEPLLAGIREAIDRRALPGAAQAVTVMAGELGERAEVLGALTLVIADTDRLRSRGLAALSGAG